MSGTSQITRKHLFHLPDGIIYLDGNSLGPLPRAVPEATRAAIADEWGEMLIGGWNKAGWFDQPARVGDAVGRLIGAPAGSVVMGDTLSIKVYQALASALSLRPDRRIVLSDNGNFPTDLYMARGLIETLGQGHELRVGPPEEVAAAIDSDVAAILLTEVDYRTGRRHDVDAITRRAHDAGAVVIWDLAHSAGALPVDVTASQCEFAVGCTYKYLNGGPGAPAFIYVRPDLADTAKPALQGWMGHDAPFAFDAEYRPALGISRMRIGTPPVIQMTVLESALAVWEGVDMNELRAASIDLMERFVAGVERRCPDLSLASPRDPRQRGSQVSFRFEHGYPAMQALIDRGVIGDFREPDIMRFGFTPLYLDAEDIDRAIDILADVMSKADWRSKDVRRAGAVT